MDSQGKGRTMQSPILAQKSLITHQESDNTARVELVQSIMQGSHAIPQPFTFIQHTSVEKVTFITVEREGHSRISAMKSQKDVITY